MTPEAAIYKFLSGFGIPAYASSSTPDEAEFPYLTYDLVVPGSFDGESTMLVNVWYRTDGEVAPNAKVREMHDAIGMGGVTLPCDNGMVWLKRGTPWAQSVVVGSDEKVKRRYVNIDLEFLTS